MLVYILDTLRILTVYKWNNFNLKLIFKVWVLKKSMIDKLPIELVYKIFDYLDYPLLYCKYLFPHYSLPDKYKLDYIKKIKNISRY